MCQVDEGVRLSVLCHRLCWKSYYRHRHVFLLYAQYVNALHKKLYSITTSSKLGTSLGMFLKQTQRRSFTAFTSDTCTVNPAKIVGKIVLILSLSTLFWQAFRKSLSSATDLPTLLCGVHFPSCASNSWGTFLHPSS